MSVTTSSPSADGMVAKRPPPTPAAKSSARAGVIQGAPQRPPPAPPRPSPGPPPVVVGSPQPPRPRAPMGAAPGIPMQKPPTVPPREASVDSIFGEDLISEKSLDEVILAYLAEDAKHPK